MKNFILGKSTNPATDETAAGEGWMSPSRAVATGDFQGLCRWPRVTNGGGAGAL
ncbi:MAG: hypothetical protein UU46_C0016G0001, partial [Candidatus Uhrbacteria bacterium GW2011_GWD1_41_16]